MNHHQFFSRSYAESRTTFRSLAEQLGWDIESHAIHGEGPNGEDLSIEVAISGQDDGNDTLVVSSGVHGVEGFFGAAVQSAAMTEMLSDGFSNTRCVFLHAVNPYGFAWVRRFDESNIDLNRNFLLESQKFRGCPDGYRALEGLLNPKSAPTAMEPFFLKSLYSIAKHGMPALKKAIADGQYEFPKGIFFGGYGPSQSNQIFRREFRRWVGQPGRVIHLDFHTGLGPWADWKLLIDHPLSKEQIQTLDEWFGSDAYERPDSEGVNYHARGGLGEWCAAQSFAENYLFCCAEFGTYNPLKVLSGLRKENQAHHWADGNQSTSNAKARLQELFCPSSDAWRSKVIRDACDLIRTSARSLSHPRQPLGQFGVDRWNQT